MSTSDRLLVGLAVAAGALAWAAPAAALGSYPYDIQGQLQLSYEPPCSVCHLRANIGVGTVRTPFAISMKAQGLKSGDDSSVWNAVAQLDKDKTDSDGDGVPDTAELRAGTDPNSPANEKLSTASDPQYGCSGTTERSGRRSGFAPFIGLGFGEWLRRFRRRRGAPRRAGRLQ